jgi:cyclophilin family peptidyl-prolyl cis-trans isomerase
LKKRPVSTLPIVQEMTMHPLVRKIWERIRRGAAARGHRCRLGFEVLEDRCVPAGSINGLVYLNTMSNGLPGAAIQLAGMPTAGTPVNLDAVTDATGAFHFDGLPDGAYHLSAGPFTGLMGTVTFGAVSASPGITVDNAVAVAGGASTQNLVITGGIDPSFITMSMFLTTTTDAQFPFLAASGAGAGNDAPFVSSVIANQTLSAATTSKIIDLAGHFSDPNITDSAVTMNVTANGIANQHINLTLSDTTTPQAVSNFFNYVNAGAYDNNFFFRNTSSAADGLDILQAGTATITNGNRPVVNQTSFPTIPDEIAALNLKGTIATANTGAANSASSQFFFNTADNPSLDHAPGSGQQGYTVFGAAADAASQAVLDTLSAVPINNLSGAATIVAGTGASEAGNTVTITTTAPHRLMVGQKVVITGVSVAAYNGSFTIDSIPTDTTFTYTNPTSGLADSGSGTVNGTGFLINAVPLTGGAATDFPTDASRYLVINSITTTRRDEILTYSIESNSNPAAVTATLNQEHLTLTRVAAGAADIVIKATDRFGATVTQTIHVVVT